MFSSSCLRSAKLENKVRITKKARLTANRKLSTKPLLQKINKGRRYKQNFFYEKSLTLFSNVFSKELGNHPPISKSTSEIGWKRVRVNLTSSALIAIKNMNQLVKITLAPKIRFKKLKTHRVNETTTFQIIWLVSLKESDDAVLNQALNDFIPQMKTMSFKFVAWPDPDLKRSWRAHPPVTSPETQIEFRPTPVVLLTTIRPN